MFQLVKFFLWKLEDPGSDSQHPLKNLDLKAQACNSWGQRQDAKFLLANSCSKSASFGSSEEASLKKWGGGEDQEELGS